MKTGLCAIILMFCYGCTNGIIEVETKEGERAKIHIKTLYEPCTIRGKSDGAQIKCEWEM